MAAGRWPATAMPGRTTSFDQLQTSKMTIVARVYVTSLANAGIAEKNVGNVANGFLFDLDSTGALRFTLERSTSNLRAMSAANAMSAGGWVQVAVTWDGTVGSLAGTHLFVNGVELAKATGSSDGSGTIGYAGATNKPFRIGNASFDFAGALNRKLVYLAVYKGRILSTTEL